MELSFFCYLFLLLEWAFTREGAPAQRHCEITQRSVALVARTIGSRRRIVAPIHVLVALRHIRSG